MHAVPFLAQLWFFLTPVVYSTSWLPQHWEIFLGLNPMTAVVDGFRYCLLGGDSVPPSVAALSVAVALGLFVSGIVWFRRRERSFVDYLGSGGA
jgi:lipopolysaccharide transport system permease protein